MEKQLEPDSLVSVVMPDIKLRSHGLYYRQWIDENGVFHAVEIDPHDLYVTPPEQ